MDIDKDLIKKEVGEEFIPKFEKADPAMQTPKAPQETFDSGDLYHIHLGPHQLTDEPIGLKEIRNRYGSVKRLESEGFRLKPHVKKSEENNTELLIKKDESPLVAVKKLKKLISKLKAAADMKKAGMNPSAPKAPKAPKLPSSPSMKMKPPRMSPSPSMLKSEVMEKFEPKFFKGEVIHAEERFKAKQKLKSLEQKSPASVSDIGQRSPHTPEQHLDNAKELMHKPQAEPSSDRLQRIQASLGRINSLMAELKAIGAKEKGPSSPSALQGILPEKHQEQRAATRQNIKKLGQAMKTTKPPVRKAELEKGDIVDVKKKNSVHGIPGQNRPEHSRGINEVVSVGDSKESSEKSLQGVKVRRGDLKGAKKAAKEILREQRKMPAPNLPKAELEKGDVVPFKRKDQQDKPSDQPVKPAESSPLVVKPLSETGDKARAEKWKKEHKDLKGYVRSQPYPYNKGEIKEKEAKGGDEQKIEETGKTSKQVKNIEDPAEILITRAVSTVSAKDVIKEELKEDFKPKFRKE